MNPNKSITVCDAPIVKHSQFAGDQFILIVESAKIAQRALPGNFAHIQVDPLLPMRRPLSIMGVNQTHQTVEFLYKVVGHGTRLLSGKAIGESLNLIGPIGNSFSLKNKSAIPLLIGGGVGIPPMVFFAERLQQDSIKAFVIMGSEVPFPFDIVNSREQITGISQQVNAAIARLEDIGVSSRLASLQNYENCYAGYTPELAELWLTSLSAKMRASVEIFSCGPLSMLHAVAKLARRYSLPCQLSLEEYMACGVGGCAGCTVAVNLSGELAMKRVCVDGPVFDAQHLAFDI